ncbi:hypothetical protein [Inquilinus sp. Marseille-Q2685]|uniref:hypothetical protein n=1 Tax=Inquilinus sp. Marseille-Q2685 TaxID=2866581 RepID=UPI001CE3BE96|nr:hypothetical protein [Inquilinus sp. Marseille-Q2685]
MSPNSSISASEARRYLLTGAAAAVALVVAICALSLWGMQNGLSEWRESELLRYQIEKIEETRQVDILLVGDSSLGNAIDARDWSRRLGLSVMSVPLVGTYGFEGTLNMLRRAVREARPRVVVVMQTLDMMRRKPSWPGALYTAETLGDLADVPPREMLTSLATWDIPAGMLKAAAIGEAIDPAIARIDYVPQNPARFGGPLYPRTYAPDAVRKDAAASLRRIGDFCRQQGLTCLYASGPYLNPQCADSRGYSAAVAEAARKAGLTPVAGTPVCMPRSDVGDSEDHVNPSRRPQYSEIHRALILAAIEGTGVGIRRRPVSGPGT